MIEYHIINWIDIRYKDWDNEKLLVIKKIKMTIIKSSYIYTYLCVIILTFKLNVAKYELNKQANIIIKLSPKIAPTPTSLAYNLKKSNI